MNLDLWTEKRQYPRASLNWPVTLISNEGTTILGRVKDMSRGGVLVHVETILKIDEQVRLAIEIPEVKDRSALILDYISKIPVPEVIEKPVIVEKPTIIEKERVIEVSKEPVRKWKFEVIRENGIISDVIARAEET